MTFLRNYSAVDSAAPPVPGGPCFTFAFQPIVDVIGRRVFSYEALIRGLGNESAFQILQQVPLTDIHEFDQNGRIAAIALAARLGITCNLNLNFLPQSLHASPDSILSTLAAADRYGLPIERITLEVTEGEVIEDPRHFAMLINGFRGRGLKVAIDDFGAGYCGLNLLADFQPDQLKIDMHLVRGIESHGPRQAIVRAILQASLDLGIDVIAEGVETEAEFRWFAQEGVRLFQGYLFAKPAFESFQQVNYPDQRVDRLLS